MCETTASGWATSLPSRSQSTYAGSGPSCVGGQEWEAGRVGRWKGFVPAWRRREARGREARERRSLLFSSRRALPRPSSPAPGQSDRQRSRTRLGLNTRTSAHASHLSLSSERHPRIARAMPPPPPLPAEAVAAALAALSPAGPSALRAASRPDGAALVVLALHASVAGAGFRPEPANPPPGWHGGPSALEWVFDYRQ